MWEWLFNDDFRRRRALKRATGPLRDYLAAPFPNRDTECSNAELVAVDFETTGLDPRSSRILSIGVVQMRGMSILLDTAWHQYVRAETELPEETVIIHQITDDQSALGMRLSDVMPRLLETLTGRVLLVHHAHVESRFLSVICRKLYCAPFVAPIIDTQVIARRMFERRHQPIKSGDLRLFNLRARYNLPHYRAHNALSDALATAELYMAMASESLSRGHCPLTNFLTRR